MTDKRAVEEVEFINHPEIKVTVLSRQAKRYVIYNLIDTTLYLEWDSRAVDSLLDIVEVNSILVTYSDGSSQEIDIGRVCIYGGESDEKILEAVDCIPLWETERVLRYVAKDTVMMDGLSEVSKEFLKTTDIIQSYS